MKVICFHNPDEENGWLSNWYLSDFTLYGVAYTSMEQYMMYQKALTFNDGDMQERIMATTDASRIKEYGRMVKGYNNTVWNGMRQIIIYEGLYAKYSQNEDLKERLLATGDTMLAECAVNDRIWGNGLSMSDEKRYDMSSWQGENLMGFTTMLVRDKLRREGK